MTELKLEKHDMTDEVLREKKLHLEFCKINKDETDINLKEMEETSYEKIASRLLDDDITKVKEDIKNKYIKDTLGNKIDLTDADIDKMKIALKKFNRQKELDIPERGVRQKINQLRESKKRMDAPEKQIKKLEKEIREKSYYLTARSRPAGMTS